MLDHTTSTAPPGTAARPAPRLRRAGVISATIVAVAAAGAAVVWRLTPSTSTTIMSAPVTIADLTQTVLATGTLKPVKLVAVGAQASGRLIALKVALGDTVRKGDLIAEIDSLTQQNALRTAQAALASVRAQRQEKEATLAHAEASLARQQVTLAQKATSRADFESAEATVKTTRAQIAALDAQIVEAEVAVETARVNLGYTRITAPIDGTVLSVVTQEGQTVNASQSAPTIVVLGRIDVMTVRAEISEADVVRVKPGQKLFFTILGEPDRRYDATLQSVEPAPESIKSDSSITSSTSSTGGTSSSSSSSSSTSTAIYYNGVFDVPNPDGRLRTYMTAQVNIVLGEAKGVLTIPAAALGATAADGSVAVRVVDADGRITARAVRVGLNDRVTAEVRSGLSAGERVVTGERTGSVKTTTGGPPPPMGF